MDDDVSEDDDAVTLSNAGSVAAAENTEVAAAAIAAS